MAINLQELTELVEKLSENVDAIIKISDRAVLRREYLKWYSQVQLLVTRHLPSMSNELSKLYYAAEDTNGEVDVARYYGIRSYLRTTPDWSDSEKSFRGRFLPDIEQQRGILLAIPHIVNQKALELAALVTADLVKGELDEARLLISHGFLRAAGAVAGVALESHLKLLHNQSNLLYGDSDSIVPLATRLRIEGIITLGDEKKCIAMADIRNLCDHKNKKEPTTDEVAGLIDDVDKFVKRIQAL